MALGERLPGMASDGELEKGPNLLEIVPHPTQIGFTIACRATGTVHPGMYAEKPEGFANTMWFSNTPVGKAAYIRRQKLAIARLKVQQGLFPLPIDMGGSATIPNPAGPIPPTIPNPPVAARISDQEIEL